MTVAEFEEAVWEVEGIRLIIRAEVDVRVRDFTWRNAAPKRLRVTEWRENRVTSLIDGHQCVVVNGNGEIPHGRTILRTLRQSYE